MRPVSGTTLSGDRFKANVALALGGLTAGNCYVLGDRLQGQLMITPLQDMEVRGIFGRLEYVIAGVNRTSARTAKSGRLQGAMRLTGGSAHKIALNIPHDFAVQNFSGRYLKGYWRLSVLIDYDPGQYERPFAEVLVGTFRDNRHQTAFTIPVRSGRGSYRVRGKALPIPFLDGKFLLSLVGIFGVALVGGIGIMAETDAGTVWPILKFGLVASLVLVLAWHFLRLSALQMTPFELTPLRDGQLRFRALDRGNGQLEKATIGYRLKELHEIKSGNSNGITRTTLLEQTFPFAEIAHRKDHLYEALIPWPEQPKFPTTIVEQDIGFVWEIFLRIPHALAGQHEVSWPITVQWEPFRLPEKNEEPLELKAFAQEKKPLQR